jgi:alkanesulfonate monooxygenase SsuD/methylene tetrahydromethanopterin reductase-like flavin-dependent oxidoreductase (luciferase family)
MKTEAVTGPGVPGLGFTPFETRAEVIVSVARTAEGLGFARISVAEAMGHASPVLLAEIATQTERVELATTVLPVWSRSPAVLAMTAAGLQRVSGGRFVLGLGAGTPPLMEGLHGIPWQDPFGKLRATLEAVRCLLGGDRMPTVPDGARPLRLAGVPERAVPIGLASMSAPGIRLAGELADRWLPFLWPRPRFEDGRRLLEEGAARRGRDGVPTISASVPLAAGPDTPAAERLAARWLTVYCTKMGPIYPRMLRERFGYAVEVDALLAANTDGGEPVLPTASRRLAEEVLALASYDEIPCVAAAWREAGADQIDLVLPFGLETTELTDLVTAAAPAPPAAGMPGRTEGHHCPHPGG